MSAITSARRRVRERNDARQAIPDVPEDRLMGMPPVENQRTVRLSSVLGSASRPPIRTIWATVGSIGSYWRSICLLTQPRHIRSARAAGIQPRSQSAIVASEFPKCHTSMDLRCFTNSRGAPEEDRFRRAVPPLKRVASITDVVIAFYERSARFVALIHSNVKLGRKSPVGVKGR